jgi:hypothetical protein
MICNQIRIFFLFLSFFLIHSVNASVWDWEDGTLQGWKTKKNFDSTGVVTGLTNTIERAYEGNRSLKYIGTGTSTQIYDWYVFVESPNIDPGDPIYFHVWIPSGVGINAVKPFMRAGDSSWVDGTYTAAQYDSWMEVIMDAPTTVPLPFLEIGIQVHTSGNPANFTIYVDYIVSGIPSPPTGFTATVFDSSSILLDWDDSPEPDLSQYYIYSALYSGFPLNDTTFLDSTIISSYLDTGLVVHNRYFYRIAAIDSAGNQSNPSSQISVYLSLPGSPPVINIQGVNTTTPGLYEKFEVLLDLQNADYSNPFDPDEIDITAYFMSPSGQEWVIFGFYDNYQNADVWKVRFAANEVGTWSFYVIATESDGSDTTDVEYFDAVQSNHHGWIHVSDDNPHYLEHDDDTGFYGIGVYSPWGNSVSRFEEMEYYGFNLFAIWNINYGGFINSYGLFETNLAEYNQEKCGRIDSMIVISEENGLHIMYCIWPHDLFSATVWATQWQNNPYRFLCNAEEVYYNPEVWNYQMKQYRYLIARFAYSRSWGIWEIINEMNGTDGWVAGYTDEAYEWVQKVDQYMEENDPYRHPTTASFSGGFSEYRPPLYVRNDMPNVHIYEEQGWPSDYPGNPYRSSLYNFAFAAQRFWTNFIKPAIFGEAGANSYAQRYGINSGTPEYTAIYHNSIWASMTNGLSMTPVWWDYPILSNNDFMQLSHFRTFADVTDFRKICTDHAEFQTDDYDLFIMTSDSNAIGWVRQVYGDDVAGTQVKIENALNDQILSYEMRYFNTWTGNFEQTRIRPYVDGTLLEILPSTSNNSPDIAFSMKPAQPGVQPYRLEAMATNVSVFNNSADTTKVFTYIFDNEGKFCTTATNLITYTLLGPGSLIGDNPANSVNGSTSILYVPSSETGNTKIVVTSSGLLPDTVEIQIENQLVIDDFESYTSDQELQTIWQPQNATDIIAYLESTNVGAGLQAARFEYDLSGDRDYAVTLRYITKSYSNECRYLKFWMIPDGSNRDFIIRIRDNSRRSMEYSFELSGTTGEYKEIPFTSFVFSADSVDLSDLEYIRFTIRQGNGSLSTGTIILDEIQFLEQPTSIYTSNDNIPQKYQLYQNYPNPFNSSTTIRYDVPERSDVRLIIYNSLGQVVETVVKENQEAGTYNLHWNGSRIASGIYFYRLKAENVDVVRKCILIK